MNQASLQVTYRHGKAFAAYLSIGDRRDRKVATSRERGAVVIDFDADENILGFELHTITAATVELLRQQLIEFHLGDISERELQPLMAA